MLETLDTIDWANVRQMFGNAADLPATVRDLTSPDADVREAAAERIDNHAVVQGALTEAAALLVPFLTEIVAESAAYGKSEALDLLFELARGYPRLSANSKTAQAWAAKAGVDLAEATRLAEEEHRNTRRALSEGTDTYCQALSASDPEVRLGAAYVLSQLPEAVAVAAEPLLTACEREADPAQRAVLLQCFGDLCEDRGVGAARLERLMSNAASDLDRTAAAAALALVMREQALVEAVHVLVHAMSATWPARPPGPTAALTVSFPLRALCALGASRATDALARCLQKPRSAHDAHRIAKALLGLSFGERAITVHVDERRSRTPRIEYRSTEQANPRSQSLSDLQYKALEAIHRCDAAWQIHTNLFGLFGLPEDRAELGRLLSSA